VLSIELALEVTEDTLVRLEPIPVQDRKKPTVACLDGSFDVRPALVWWVCKRVLPFEEVLVAHSARRATEKGLD
jgi:hypothetical protein